MKVHCIQNLRKLLLSQVFESESCCEKLAHRIKILPLHKASKLDQGVVLCIEHGKENKLQEIDSNLKDNNLFKNARKVVLSKKHRRTGTLVNVDLDCFQATVLRNIVVLEGDHGVNSDYHNWKTDAAGRVEHKSNERIVIDFSSPNIAKPFHAGHLRSTVIGSFIARLYSALGHTVTKLNYYGDWGKQFGLLATGFLKYGNNAMLNSDAVSYLYDIYVRMNSDVEDNSTIAAEVDVTCAALNQGDENLLKLWSEFRQCSIDNYSRVYKRLNVHFDVNEWESEHDESAKRLAAQLVKEEKAIQSSDGHVHININVNDEKPISLLKSDGSSLYLTRDLAAAIHRKDKFNFDKMYYVVEQGQANHFKHLVMCLKFAGFTWADRLQHIQFGRLSGMSTRKGTAIFLSDILDEARERMLEKMKVTKTTQSEGSQLHYAAEMLGISAVMIHDLKFSRMRGSKFNWDELLKLDGDTGPFLQITNARLCSLRRNCGVELDLQTSALELTEQDALILIVHLARYDEVIAHSADTLEAHVLVRYLLDLCHFANAAIKRLRVKNEEKRKAQARLLLFHCTQLTLSNGLSLLGVTPLTSL